MKMEINSYGIGYFSMRAGLLKKRLKLKKVKCNDCGEELTENTHSTLIPILNSIFCEHCSQVQLHNLEGSKEEEDFQMVKEMEYMKKFMYD